MSVEFETLFNLSDVSGIRQRSERNAHSVGFLGWGRTILPVAASSSSCPRSVSAVLRSASKARSPARCQRARRWAGSSPSAPRSCPARSKSAPSRVARSSSSSSTRSALATRPPSSIRWRVRSRRALAQSRVSVRAHAASSLLRATASRRSLVVVARRSASRFSGTCLAASLAPLLKQGLAAFGPPLHGFG